MKVLGHPATPSAHVNCRENAPVHRHKMWCECNDHLSPGGKRELLVELGHVPVMTNTIGVKTFGNLGKEHRLLGRAPCSGHAGLRIDDNFVQLDSLVLDQRDKW